MTKWISFEELRARLTPNELEEIASRLNAPPSNEEIKQHQITLAEMIYGNWEVEGNTDASKPIKDDEPLPTGYNMVMFTEREVHMIQIVMRLLRRRKIFTHTPNIEVFDMVKREYYNDVHKG